MDLKEQLGEENYRLLEENLETVKKHLRKWIRTTDSPDKELCEKVMIAFRVITGKQCTLTKTRQTAITKRWREGNELPQFEAVIRHQKEEWEGTEHEKYITPETLFADKHFQKYLEAAREAYRNKTTTKRKMVS